MGSAASVNGIVIQGPNDAGGVNLDEAGFQVMCGGHVTPPTTFHSHGGNPIYHYHKAPDCSPQFKDAAKTYDHGGRPETHGQMYGYALDGFGIYAFGDWDGLAPVLDECGGQFGPVPGENFRPGEPCGVGEADCCNTGHEASCRVVYHYHATTYCPYHMACQGPALGQCNRTQYGQPHLRPQGVTETGIGNANFCGKGCGADVCVQPGTPEPALRHYLARWNETWLDSYSVNAYKLTPREERLEATVKELQAEVARLRNAQRDL